MSTNPSPAVQNMPPLAQGSGAFPMHPSGSLYVGDLAPDVTVSFCTFPVVIAET